MAKPVESELTISCLQCEWSVETVNTPAQVSRAFLEAAHSHANEHEQHALEVVQRLRIYSENYVELEPPAGPGCAGDGSQTRSRNTDRLSGQVSQRALRRSTCRRINRLPSA